MKHMTIGMFFLLFNFYIGRDNGGVVHLIPSFVGYAFIFRGLNQLHDENNFFARMIPWSGGMFIWHILFWIVSFSGGMYVDNALVIVIELVPTIIQLYILWQIINGIQDMEHRHGNDYESILLRKAWYGLLAFIPMWLFSLTAPQLGLLFFIAMLAISAVFLYRFCITNRLYRERYLS